MTPLDAVTADFLRERYDEATVQRLPVMLTGVVWLCEEHRNWEGEECFAVRATEYEAIEATRQHHKARGREGDVEFGQMDLGSWDMRAFADGAEYWLTPVSLSPAEKQTAESAPRPEGEAVTCRECGAWGSHRCVCNDFPGAGAG